MPNFFINRENIRENQVFIRKISDIRHILYVLRYKEGDNVILIGPESNMYDVRIISVSSDMITCEILDSYISDKKLSVNITLAQSVIKSQKQDFIIQKATELGVREIIPFISKNTVAIPNNPAHKVQRWQKIIYESAKQCQRGDIACISEITTLQEVLKLEGFDLKVLCSEKKADISIKKLLAYNKKPGNILVITGPEGGWDDSELEEALNYGIIPVTLGRLVYRAETAAIAAISQVIYEYEL